MKLTLDEHFTNLADSVSEGMGKWWVSVISAFLIIIWTLYCMVTQGSGWWYGIFYNLPLNLVTTIAELFIGFLLASAANRVERRHDLLLEYIKAQAELDVQTTQNAKQDIQALMQDIADIKQAVLPHP